MWIVGWMDRTWMKGGRVVYISTYSLWFPLSMIVKGENISNYIIANTIIPPIKNKGIGIGHNVSHLLSISIAKYISSPPDALVAYSTTPK